MAPDQLRTLEPDSLIVVVDYGVGNLSSVANMLSRAGVMVSVSSDAAVIKDADKVLLPGVGHFDHGMRMLRKAGIEDALTAFMETGKPLLGICLGAQILGKGSEEGDEPGLGWLDMECRRLPEGPGVRVPHMGWNKIEIVRECALFNDFAPDHRYYFAHSYYMDCADTMDVIANTEHGVRFTCVVQCKNVIGTQFHPEKSLRHGLAMMRAFVAM